MDVTCPNCGSTNRNTSRFCARCGELLHPEGEGEQGTSTSGGSQGGLDLPWLQTVQDRALKPKTERLTDAQPIQPTPPSVEQGQPRQGGPVPSGAGAPSERTPTSGATTVPGTGPSSEQPPPEPEPDPHEAPPQWVVSILEPTAGTPTGQEQTYEPEELEHIMPWVHGQQAPSASSEQSAQDSASGLPPWLSDITVQETLQGSTGGSHEQGVPLPPELELEGIEPFVPPTLPEDEHTGTQVTGSGRPQEQVPSWLRSLTGKDEREPVATPESFTSRPLMPIEGLAPVEAPLAREIAVLPPRAGSVEALASLIGASGASAAIPRQVGQEEMRGQGAIQEAPTTSKGMTRLLPDGIIYLAILGVLLAMLIVRPDLGEITAPSAPGVQSFYDEIEKVSQRALAQEQIVLVAYDWDATRSAEMSLLAESVMRHLMWRKIRFITVSTNPQGPGFAQQITSRLRDEYSYLYGRDYLVMGYLPGSQAALGALVGNFRANLPIDYEQNRRLSAHTEFIGGSTLQSINDFALVIALTSEEAELRNWVEQVGARTGRPIVAAVPQSMDPLARPYMGIPGAGLKALISGPTGALQYTKQLQSQGIPIEKTGSISLSDRLNAQSAAQLLVALVIIAALVGAATRRVGKR
jgi:hypothetical protein